MKEKKDLEQQKEFDQIEFTQEDKKLYELLFEELSKEDEIVINPDFAPEITARINKKRRREQLKENFFFAAAIILVVVINHWRPSIRRCSSRQRKFDSNNRFFLPLLSLIGMITIFQILDKVYIRNRRFKQLKKWRS